MCSLRASLALALALGTAEVAAVPLTSATAAASAPFEHFWKRCVGSGHMLLGTRSDWRTHLKLAHDECGFTGIRGHGLFDDDMSVVPRKAPAAIGQCAHSGDDCKPRRWRRPARSLTAVTTTPPAPC